MTPDRWPAIVLLAATTTAARAEMAHMEEFSRPFSVSVTSQAQNYSFDMSGGAALNYVPNVASRTVISANCAGLGGLSYGFRQSSGDNSSAKGATRYEDWRFNFPYRQLNVFAFYSRFRGFYLSNSNSVDSSLPTAAPYIKFPDLYAANMGVTFTWVWNPERFSLAAVMDFTERQLKAGGSLLVGLAVTETIFRNSGAIIPAQAKSAYGDDSEVYEGRVRALSAKVGWGYTDVYRRKWFTSFQGSIGVGPQEVRFSTSREDYSIYRLNLNLIELYGAAGYNGDRFFSGIKGSSAVAQYQADKAVIATSLVEVGFFVGTRF